MNFPLLAETNLSLVDWGEVGEATAVVTDWLWTGWQAEIIRHANKTSSAEVRHFGNIFLL
jgi:hypothetical protein